MKKSSVGEILTNSALWGENLERLVSAVEKEMGH